MKAKYANPFLSSVANVVEMTTGLKMEKGSIQKGNGIESDKLYTLFFTIDTGLTGYFALSFDEEVALNLVEKMTGEKKETIDEMGISALVEMSEMIKGNALTELAGLGVECEAGVAKIKEETDHFADDSIVLSMNSELGVIDNHIYVKEL
ncbi:hypothetical protein CN918_25260 [Priestia megaterium]|nr:hypothetical protein CN918_25260 [Priestia megaterium]